MLDTTFPGVNRLFFMGFNNNAGDNHVLRDFYGQNISDDFEKYGELRKVMTGRGEDYTTGSLLDYDYWEKKL